ncbi:MAG TPA: DNA polymerase III subunit gamma/tau, partial [Planctomycetaceae bacterium]|nr:DNA polymerase III subunit gamma/tau [Planctomycetaceae bacterium]
MEARASTYTAMARRFRPQTFDEVVGQQHVARALRNAIAAGRVSHAYLFTGARGVGKTSMARILAKALNCPNAADGVPCNECDICHGISAGNDVDVLEIDGASNRGIDDIRTLRAGVNVRSMRTRFKIYIIDEVHMLTKEAFNALLKTLEEPPPSVKFVFCTTEPNKVPDTILSRCQRFDFSTIETARIVERLHEIAAADGFHVEPAALELVARRAAGSMRDSQSLFDQLLAFGQDRITASDVHRLLGTASDDRLMDLAEALIARSEGAALELFDRALNEGVQIGEFVNQLVGYLRDLMIVASGAEGVALLSVSGENRERLADQAGRWGMQTILAALQILADARSRMARVTFERPVAELALVRIALLGDLESIGRLLEELRNGQPPAASAALAQRSRTATPRSPSEPLAEPAGQAAPQKKSADDQVVRA